MLRLAPRRHLVALAIGVVALAGCKKDPPPSEDETEAQPAEPAPPVRVEGPGRWIPGSATVVGGIDVVGLVGSPLWKSRESVVREEAGDVLAAMERCDLGLPRWKRITFGLAPDLAPDAMVVIIEATGVGTPRALACAERELRQSQRRAPWIVLEPGRALRRPDGSVVRVVDDDTLVWSSASWDEEVEELLGGEGRSAFAGPLAPVIARSDTAAHLWFAGLLPEAARAMAEARAGLHDPRDLAGWLDLGEGVQAFVAVGLPSEDEARAAASALQQQLGPLGTLAKQVGVPATVVDSVKIDTQGSAVTVRATMTTADLAHIDALVEARKQAAEGSSPPSGATPVPPPSPGQPPAAP